MSELFGRDDDIAVWHAAARGEPADLNAMLDGYEATVDWPAAAFWPELRDGQSGRGGAAVAAQLAGGLVGTASSGRSHPAADAGAARGRALERSGGR